jgi:hypothetical protein
LYASTLTNSQSRTQISTTRSMYLAAFGKLTTITILSTASISKVQNLGRCKPARLIYIGSHFLTTPHDLHRARRKPLEPYFSRLGISKLEPIIHELIEKIIKRFIALEGTGAIVRLDHAMICYTGDMVQTPPSTNSKCCLEGCLQYYPITVSDG